jgi:E3 ubiquitin-protein ligase UBR4
MLPDMNRFPRACANFFEFFKKVLSTYGTKAYVVFKGLFTTTLHLLLEEKSSVTQYDRFGTEYSFDFQTGLLNLLDHLLSDAPLRSRCKSRNPAGILIQLFITLRELRFLKSTSSERNCDSILAIIEAIYSDSEEDRRSLLSSYTSVLKKIQFQEELRSAGYVLEQIKLCISPSSYVKKFQVFLKKSPTQEEFIRGYMKKNPYCSREFGSRQPLLRDVKKVVCSELGIEDAENILELLVDNKIINLDLPLGLVYEKIWCYRATENHAYEIDDEEEEEEEDFGEDCMIVVYRLQGIDGEATEDVIETIPVSAADPSQQYAVSTAFVESDGVCLLKDWLKSLLVRTDNRSLWLEISQVFFFCFQVPQNVEACSNDFDLLLTLLEATMVSLQCNLEKEISRNLVFCAYTLSSSCFEMMIPDVYLERLCKITEYLFSLASSATFHSFESSEFLSSVLAILAMKTNKLNTLWEILYQVVSLWSKKDAIITDDLSNANEFLKVFCKSLTGSHRLVSIQQFLWEKQMFHSAAKYCINLWPQLQSLDKNDLRGIVDSLPWLTSTLITMEGLCFSCPDFQKVVLESDLLPVLHTLEKTSSLSSVGPMSESVLEAFARTNLLISARIKELRDSFKSDRKRKARAQKERLLKKMKLSTASVSRPKTAASDFFLRCLICHEGFAERPNHGLGVYVFCKEVLNLSKSCSSLSTVSHFHVIHIQCHRDAAKADRNLRQPKTEWEGAALRNSQTLCNNLLPIYQSPASSTAENEYFESCRVFWENLPFRTSLERSRVSIICRDLSLLFDTFALNSTFSQFSKGGGPESNANLITYYIQFCLMLRDIGTPKHLEDALNLKTKFLSTDALLVPEDRRHNVVMSLFMIPQNEWSELRSAVFKFIVGNLKEADFSKGLLMNLISFHIIDRIRLICVSIRSSIASLNDMRRLFAEEHEKIRPEVTTMLLDVITSLSPCKSFQEFQKASGLHEFALM